MHLSFFGHISRLYNDVLLVVDFVPLVLQSFDVTELCAILLIINFCQSVISVVT